MKKRQDRIITESRKAVRIDSKRNTIKKVRKKRKMGNERKNECEKKGINKQWTGMKIKEINDINNARPVCPIPVGINSPSCR